AAPGGEGIVVVVGRPSLAERGELVAEAAVALAEAWPEARFLPALRRGNVMGALDMGLAPGVLPGRVSLDDGRAWFSSAWGSVPSERGRDTTEMLSALAEGTMKGVFLLGADPLGDFPDANLAQQALERASLVVSVDSFLSPSSALAHVVLPVASVHERAGTTTNVEGRITRLGQKVVPPGRCRPDWMVASEIAMRLGADLGVTQLTEIWDEIERLAPSHAGITRAVLERPSTRDGVVAPLSSEKVSIGRPPAARIDPMATPGIESVEVQGAPLRASQEDEPGSPSSNGGPAHSSDVPAGSLTGVRPRTLSRPERPVSLRVPPPDSYSMRLVAPRRLYDDGVMLGACDSLDSLAPAAVAHLNPEDLDRLGVASGGNVRLRSSRGAVVLEALADGEVTKGVAVVGFNLDAADSSAASALIDSAQPVTDVRLETP
ncbi:MAG: molybdopterin oxidoreductase family protein, partial [Acidimicrobiales bacterium]